MNMLKKWHKASRIHIVIILAEWIIPGLTKKNPTAKGII